MKKFIVLTALAIGFLSSGVSAKDFPCNPASGNWINASVLTCPSGTGNRTDSYRQSNSFVAPPADKSGDEAKTGKARS